MCVFCFVIRYRHGFFLVCVCVCYFLLTSYFLLTNHIWTWILVCVLLIELGYLIYYIVLTDLVNVNLFRTLFLLTS